MDPSRRALLRGLIAMGLAGCAPARRTAAPSTAPIAGASSSPARPRPGGAATAAPTVPRVRTAVSRALVELPTPSPGGQDHTISGLMLHHTATPAGPVASAPGRLRDHARNHQGAGFVDIAYHWAVDAAGTVYELRDEGIAGETFTGYDPAGWLLVVCEGNFQEAAPTGAMLAAAADVFAAGAARHGVDPATLRGHRDLADTACPGDELQARLGDLVGMVEQRLAAGGVTLVVSDDPALLP